MHAEMQQYLHQIKLFIQRTFPTQYDLRTTPKLIQSVITIIKLSQPNVDFNQIPDRNMKKWPKIEELEDILIKLECLPREINLRTKVVSVAMGYMYHRI